MDVGKAQAVWRLQLQLVVLVAWSVPEARSLVVVGHARMATNQCGVIESAAWLAVDCHAWNGVLH